MSAPQCLPGNFLATSFQGLFPTRKQQIVVERATKRRRFATWRRRVTRGEGEQWNRGKLSSSISSHIFPRGYARQTWRRTARVQTHTHVLSYTDTCVFPGRLPPGISQSCQRGVKGRMFPSSFGNHPAKVVRDVGWLTNKLENVVFQTGSYIAKKKPKNCAE